jgi:hypothetical protein
LFDLIDEEFVVNCGVFGGHIAGQPSQPPSHHHHHRRKSSCSILDMIDRIADGDKSDEVMMGRSYPRGVYVTPLEETTAAVGNVGFVAAQAFSQWRT